ncbi:MAG: shikimate kinase [Candidatus Omnitrophica bacterium]|nr:shikimate kinase [Candidatus Omnitrophota bacterium]
MKNIALVGFMGTGKSTIAALLSKKLQVGYVDLDRKIEEKEGMRIVDIFSQKGEPYFRKVEKDIVAKIFRRENKIIACGGGVVLDDENVESIKKSGFMICLEATPEVILKRTKSYKHRPLLNVGDPELKIYELLKKRKPYYAKADYTVDTSGLSTHEVVSVILSWLEGKT